MKKNKTIPGKKSFNSYKTTNKVQQLSAISLKYFLHEVFKILNPSTPLAWNWHLTFLCDVLEKVANHEIRRLMINIPPRYLKSILCSVAFPAWILGRDPTKRIIVASYSKHLAVKHSMDCRQVMQSDWYKKCFPETIIADGANEKTKFCTTKNGFRFATSIGGTLTGEGGDILIVDDPHNPMHIFKKNTRNKVINWFGSVFSSRLNNKKTGSIMIVMQRLHEEDLCGYLLKETASFFQKKEENKDISDYMHGSWFHINLPVIADENICYQLGDKIYKNRKIGDILHKSIENKAEIARIKTDLGEYNFSAQYLQKPISMNGNIIQRKWLKYFDYGVFLKEQATSGEKLQYYISIDCASGVGTENDYTAVAVFIVLDNKFYLCNMYRLKVIYPFLKQTIADLIIKYNPIAVLIEDKSNGTSLIQDLQTEHNNIIAIKPIYSKEYRVNEVLTVIEAGSLFLASNQSWLKELEVELLSFPNCQHDDQVDTISQFINWYRTARINQLPMKVRILSF